MNKRHYEHTLPNIRGSLSNTYSIGYFDNYFAYTCMDNVIPAQIAYAISYVKFSIYIHTYIVISQLPISTII